MNEKMVAHCKKLRLGYATLLGVPVDEECASDDCAARAAHHRDPVSTPTHGTQFGRETLAGLIGDPVAAENVQLDERSGRCQCVD
jgi:hypothetical protein